MKKKKGISRFSLLIIIIPFIFLASYVGYKYFFEPEPFVEGTEDFQLLPAVKNITLHCENIKSLNISIYQDDKQIELLKDIPQERRGTYTLQIKPKDLGLKDGNANVTVKAKAGILKGITYKISSIIDTVPPSLGILKASTVVDRGSAGFAVLEAKGADSVFVKLDNQKFRAFKTHLDEDTQSDSTKEYEIETQQALNHSQSLNKAIYYVFFPAPYDIRDGSLFYVVAEDAVGNKNIKKLPTKLKTKKYRKSNINIDDTFINMVVAPLLNETNLSNYEEAFIKVNEEWRKKASEKLFDIAQKTESSILWEGSFLQLKNSKVMATYGDERTFIYNGKPISKSVHLGYDLASFANAPVEAANTGIVKFAGDLGIYGNTVVIDHGLGLMSLYGHLSMMAVSEGQAVKKGEIIGETGSTGFASGDHLHFGILIHGHEVSPLYWWDQEWIKKNILDYLNFNTPLIEAR